MEEDLQNVLVNATEFKTKRLYFVSLSTNAKPTSTSTAHYFSTDDLYVYDNFYYDFGPLNLAMLYRYCVRLTRKLKSVSLADMKIVHYSGPSDEKRVNAAFLIGSYAVIFLGLSPERVFHLLCLHNKKAYVEFRDASMGDPYRISLLDCLKAVRKAFHYGFVNFHYFEVMCYEYWERVENGDLNWIVPNKFLAFCGPHEVCKVTRGYPIHSPQTYFAYFRVANVKTIIRLNKKVYDENQFIDAGFEHFDLYFIDGGNPTDKILEKFLAICEARDHGIAVHCKAGLGRTGTLIACYIMKHYRFTAEEAIAWIRICRPGSVIGHQQAWLKEKQEYLWRTGEEYRRSRGVKGIVKNHLGINSGGNISFPYTGRVQSVILNEKKKKMELNGPDDTDIVEFVKDDDANYTQGDHLQEIKAQRARSRSTSTVPQLRGRSRDPRLNRTRSETAGTSGKSGKSVKSGKSGANEPFIYVDVEEVDSASNVFVKRKDTQNPPRTKNPQRKVTFNLVPTPIKITKGVSSIKRPKVKENVSCWAPKPETATESKPLEKTSKRGKRALTSEKDKTNTRSMKFLRRSSDAPAQSGDKLDVSLCLPVVKINKSI